MSDSGSSMNRRSARPTAERFDPSLMRDLLAAWHGVEIGEAEGGGIAASARRVADSLEAIAEPASPASSAATSLGATQQAWSGPLATTLAAAVDAFAHGELPAVGMVTTACDRARSLQGDYLAFIGVEDAQALSAAGTLDAARDAGRPAGRLAGAVIAHKDTFAFEGRRPTCGSLLPLWEQGPTAAAISRLERAGAIDIGGLNTSDGGLNPFGLNRLTGPARNPWNRDHVAGGSSSGSAVAVAAGLVNGSLGSDTGGSIRIPAAFCGVVGLKPTDGAVDRAGVFPLSRTLDCPGPMARTVADCAALYEALHDAGPGDAQALDATVAGRRVGIPRSFFFDDLDAPTAAAMDEAMRILVGLGIELVATDVPDVGLFDDIVNVIAMSEGAAVHRRWLAAGRHLYTPVTRNALEFGLSVPAARYLEALAFRTRFAPAAADSAFAGLDAIVMPTTPTVAPAMATVMALLESSDNLPFALGRNTKPANFLGVPALTVPCGFSPDGLPVGLQFIARPRREQLLFNLGHVFQRATDFHLRRPNPPSGVTLPVSPAHNPEGCSI